MKINKSNLHSLFNITRRMSLSCWLGTCPGVEQKKTLDKENFLHQGGFISMYMMFKIKIASHTV